MYVFNLYNYQSGGVSLLFLALFEVLTIAWGYGANRFAKDIETMIGYKISPWWPIAWKFASPVVILGMYKHKILRPIQGCAPAEPDGPGGKPLLMGD